MIDTHCHLTDPQLFGERDQVIKRGVEAGIKGFINNGAGTESSMQGIRIAEEFPGVYTTVGIHPEEIAEWKRLGDTETKRILLELCSHKKVVAIGEAGFDIYETTTAADVEEQKKLFEINVWLAEQTGLPMVIHNRNADTELISALKDRKLTGQLHCFVGSEEYAVKMINMGFYVSLGGILTFKKSTALRETAKNLPIERILIETDAPYLAPEPLRGQRNEPKNVKIVMEAFAQLKSITLDEVSKVTQENARCLFPKLI